MLGMHRRKEMTNIKILAPLAGQLIPLTEVEDPIFSQKTMGEGFGIKPTGDRILAPVTGAK